MTKDVSDLEVPFTYGLELEYGDFDKRGLEEKLPKGVKLDKREQSVVNSDGTAVDPSLETCPYGGELNTCPTKTIKGQLELVKAALNVLSPKPTPTYRCHIHTHVGFPEEMHTLENYKKLLKYSKDNFGYIVDVLNLPGKKGTKETELHKSKPRGLWSQYRRDIQIPDWKVDFLLNTKSIEEFRKNFMVNKNGENAPTTFRRAGVNIYSLFMRKTIEFRFFYSTTDLEILESDLRFSKNFVYHALYTGIPVKEWFKLEDYKFQKEHPFSLEIEQKYQATKVTKNTVARYSDRELMD